MASTAPQPSPRLRARRHGHSRNRGPGATRYRVLFKMRMLGLESTIAAWSGKVVKSYNGRGTAEQWIKEGKYAVKWTRLSCRNFRDNQARLQLFALPYDLGNFLRRLAQPRNVQHWSLTTLREKLIKIGAKVVRHAKYVTFQLAEVAVPRELFAAILDRIQRFGVPPPLAQRG